MRRSIPRERMPFVIMTRRDHVRYMATSRPAVSMTKELRRAAARDPGLEWDPETHRYRLRRRGDGTGGGKVSDGLPSGPAAATGINANTSFPAGTPARETRARARAHDEVTK